MPILEGPVEIKASKGDILWSEDPSVDSGKKRGWVPADDCTFKDGAHVLSIKSLNPSQLRRCRDVLYKHGLPSSNRATNALGVVKVAKGDREWKGQDKETWLDWLETRDPLASDLLAEYIAALSNGTKLEAYHERAKRLIDRAGDAEEPADAEETADGEEGGDVAASKSPRARAD